jgi:hypothetical protein
LPKPIVVDMPGLSGLDGFLDLHSSFCRSEVADELVSHPSLVQVVKLVLAADQIADVSPAFGRKILVTDLAMARNMHVLGTPSRLVAWIVTNSGPHVGHPSIDVLLLESVGDSEPAVLKKMLYVFRLEILILHLCHVEYS